MIDEERLKRTFEMIRKEISSLNTEIIAMKREILALKNAFENQAHLRHISGTQNKPLFKSLNFRRIKPYFQSSTRNDGVQALRQQSGNSQAHNLDNSALDKETSAQLSTAINNLKTDLKQKFKSLTKQEFLIFSKIYTLQEELNAVTYTDIASQTGLTENAVRDYISRLIHKGIPIIKERINNRQVILKIPQELKKIATLENLTKLKRF